MGTARNQRLRVVAAAAVILAGVVAAVVLLRAGGPSSTPDSPTPARTIYFGWAALATFGTSLAAAGVVYAAASKPRSPALQFTLVALVCAIAVSGLGEAAVYVAEHPDWGICRKMPSGRLQCAQQPNKPASQLKALELFTVGLFVILGSGMLAGSVIDRRHPHARSHVSSSTSAG